MDAADTYVARIDAVKEQAARLRAGRPPLTDRWGSVAAARFRFDPAQPLTGAAAALAPYVRADDVVIDVGGGGGRVSLALAGRCREVVNVEPSPGMGQTFLTSVSDTGISNARWVQSDWIGATGVTGDVAIVAHVTYFVREIVPFIEALQARVRRRIAIVVGSYPPPSNMENLFFSVLGEPLVAQPGHRELLPVLWEMGILPDVLVSTPPEPPLEVAPTEREAVSLALRVVGLWLECDLTGDEALQKVVQSHFDALFTRVEGGWRGRWLRPQQQLLITWETRSKA